MCGIYVSFSSGRRIFPSDELKQALRRRGPHSYTEKNGLTTHDLPEEIKNGASIPVKFYVYATVLGLRGSRYRKEIAQPIADIKSGSFFCWNGEAWKISGIPVEGYDTEAVSSMLFNCKIDLDPGSDTEKQFPTESSLDPAQKAALRAYSQEISRIEGPFAFVFWDNKHKLVLFGRDFLGRRSLVLKVNHNQGLAISSVCSTGESEDWIEVAANGIYYMNFKNGWPPATESLGAIPWGFRSRNSVADSQALKMVGALIAMQIYMSNSHLAKSLRRNQYSHPIRTTEGNEHHKLSS